AVDEQACRIELGPCLRELPLDHLEVRDRAAELLALLRVGRRGLERRSAETNGERTDTDAPLVEHLFHVGERIALAADQIAGRDAAVLHHKLRGVRRVEAHLALALPRTDAVSLRGPLPTLTTKKPAIDALVMNCFVPLRTKPSPTFFAVLCTAIASEPEPGSVSAHAPRCLPDASGGI